VFLAIVLGIVAVALFIVMEWLLVNNDVPPVPEERQYPAAEQFRHLLTAYKKVVIELDDLEFEHDIGHISVADYLDLRIIERRKAMSILRKLDYFFDL